MKAYTLDTLVKLLNDNCDPYCGLDFYTICNANDPEDLNEYTKRIRQREADYELEPCTIPTEGYFLYEDESNSIVVFDSVETLVNYAGQAGIEYLESINE